MRNLGGEEKGSTRGGNVTRVVAAEIRSEFFNCRKLKKKRQQKKRLKVGSRRTERE